MRAKLRIGLLVDRPSASKYVHDFVEWAQAHSNLCITHLVVHAPAPVPRGTFLATRLFRFIAKNGIYAALSRISFSFVLTLERKILKRDKRYEDHLREFDLLPLVPDKIAIAPIVSKSGFVYRFSEADIAKVKSLDLDILIRCGTGILRGEILRAARHGIISFHHADNRINRGSPPGFWEVYFRHDTTGFTLQRLTEELDGGDVLMRGHFQTQYYYLLNEAALFEKSNSYLKCLVEEIATNGRLPASIPSVPYSHQLFRVPTAYEVAVYLTKLCFLIFRKKVRELVGIRYRWNVAYVQGGWRNAVLWRAKRLTAPEMHFLADPFVVCKEGERVCFVEEIDCRNGRGHIAAYKISEQGGVRVGTALKETFHLSFPYIFEYQQELFMCPETSENKDIRIYKCMKFPLRWRLEKIIMKDVSAADTLLFEKDGRWWMLTNTDSANSGDYCSELSIFSSDSPFAEQWKPHPRNPVIVDSARARNAGLLRDGDSLFRVAQAQGFDLYGKSSAICKIVELNDSNYDEAIVSEIRPAFTKDAVGTHHMHSDGDVTVFDFLSSRRY